MIFGPMVLFGSQCIGDRSARSDGRREVFGVQWPVIQAESFGDDLVLCCSESGDGSDHVGTANQIRIRVDQPGPELAGLQRARLDARKRFREIAVEIGEFRDGCLVASLGYLLQLLQGCADGDLRLGVGARLGLGRLVEQPSDRNDSADDEYPWGTPVHYSWSDYWSSSSNVIPSNALTSLKLISNSESVSGGRLTLCFCQSCHSRLMI